MISSQNSDSNTNRHVWNIGLQRRCKKQKLKIPTQSIYTWAQLIGWHYLHSTYYFNPCLNRNTNVIFYLYAPLPNSPRNYERVFWSTYIYIYCPILYFKTHYGLYRFLCRFLINILRTSYYVKYVITTLGEKNELNIMGSLLRCRVQV